VMGLLPIKHPPSSTSGRGPHLRSRLANRSRFAVCVLWCCRAS